jgi:flagellar hook protein FlgE
MGYSLANGATSPSVNSLSDFVPVNLAALGMQASGSTSGTFKGNLPYGESIIARSFSATPHDPLAPAASTSTIDITGMEETGVITFTIGGTARTVSAAAVKAATGGLAPSDFASYITTNQATLGVTAAVSGGNVVLTGVSMTDDLGAVSVDVDGAGTSTKQSSLQVYDNVGNPVKLDILLTKTSTDTWDISISSNNTLLSGPTPLTFNPTGQLVGPTTLPSFTIPNGKPFSLDLTGMTQLAGEYSVTGSANGNAPSAVKDAEFASDGTVYAVYEDGTRVAAYRIPLATVASPDNLNPRAGNVYEATARSGDYIVGFPEAGGFGTVQSSALEGSNVDIGTELTAMIEAQTGYTANSKVFQTGSELLDVLMNLKR